MDTVIGIIILLCIMAVISAAIVIVTRLSPTERDATIRRVLFVLAVAAEKAYGSKTGQLKKNQVIAWFYEKYKWLSLFVSTEELSELVDEAAANITEWFKSNPEGANNALK